MIKLTAENFKREVLESENLWLVKFYAPWCSECTEMKPEWTKAANFLKGVIKMGVVDMTTDSEAGKPY